MSSVRAAGSRVGTEMSTREAASLETPWRRGARSEEAKCSCENTGRRFSGFTSV